VQMRALGALTTASGRARVQGAPAGEVTVLASASGRCGRAETKVDVGSRRELSILLSPTRAVDVHVTALPDGVPVANAQVEVLEKVSSRSNGGTPFAKSWG